MMVSKVGGPKGLIQAQKNEFRTRFDSGPGCTSITKSPKGSGE